jgi:PAS domain S-box-containing protein
MIKCKEVIENAPDIIIIADGSTVKYINKYGLAKFGYKKKEVKGFDFFNLLVESDRHSAKRNHSNVSKDKTVTYEVTFLRNKKNDNLFRGEVKTSLIKSKDKYLNLLIVREIDSRKKIDDIFNQQERKFHAITENTPDIIARFDEDCRYVYVNDAMEKLFNIPKKDFFWKNDKELGIQGERTCLFCDAINHVFKKKEKKEFYVEETINNEKKYFHSVIVPEMLKDGSVVSALSITRDITEIKEIDQVKSEFISITTHQLRSPLSAINWCTQSLLNEGKEAFNEEQKGYLENIHESTQKLIKITDTFLQATIIELEMFIINLEKVDIIPLLKEAVNSFKEKALQKKLTFNENYESSLIMEVDPRALNIIFRNIVFNAIEYNEEGGSFDVILERQGDEVVFQVGDSGCGIKEEDKSKIFAKFYRSEKARSIKTYGTGLDLYITKELINKMQGRIEVESPNKKYNKGSLFKVFIPIKVAKKSCEKDSSLPSSSCPSSSCCD